MTEHEKPDPDDFQPKQDDDDPDDPDTYIGFSQPLPEGEFLTLEGLPEFSTRATTAGLHSPGGVPTIPTQGGYFGADFNNLLRGGNKDSIDPSRISGIQSALIAVGLLRENESINPGEWDDNTRRAFKEILAISNRSGTTWDSTLRRLLRTGTFLGADDSGGGAARRAPFVARPPNRDEVKRGWRQIRASMLGGQFATADNESFKAEQEAFANAFEKTHVDAQRAAYDGRSVEQPPSLQSAVEENVEDTEEAGVGAFSFAGLARAMTRGLGRG